MTTIINHLLNIEEADLDQPDDIFEEMEEEYADTHNHGEAFVEIGVGSMRNGIRFKDHDIGVKSIENWCKLAFCPLTKRRFRKGEYNSNTDRWRPARRDWACCHGIKCNNWFGTD